MNAITDKEPVSAYATVQASPKSPANVRKTGSKNVGNPDLKDVLAFNGW